MSERPFVIAILSGKGGVGKTTISLNLAKELASRGPVWLIDIDLFNRGSTSALWESEKGMPLSVAELILATQTFSERGDREQLAAFFSLKVRAALESLAYDSRLTFLPAARAVEGKEASYVLWRGMAELGLSAEIFVGALADACGALTAGGVVILDGHGGLDELSLAAAVVSDTCYIVNEPDLITFTGSVTLFREVREQARRSPHDAWVEFIINRVSPKDRIKRLEEHFGPMLDSMSPAPEAVAVYFPLERELFGVFGDDPFVSQLYTRYWFSRKIALLAEKVAESGIDSGVLDPEWWRKPRVANPAHVRTALQREIYKRGDVLLFAWLSMAVVGLIGWVWDLLATLRQFSTPPPSSFWFACVASAAVLFVMTVRWLGVQREHVRNIRRLRGRPERRLRYGSDSAAGRARERLETVRKTRSAWRPLAFAGIVMATLGIFAAIAIPNLLTAMQRSKQKRSMADMRSITTAWEARAIDENSYGAAGQFQVGADFDWLPREVDPKTLEGMLTPTYIRVFPAKDGWQHLYDYAVSLKADGYSIRSAGRDGAFEQTKYVVGATKSFNNDIVFSDGYFVTWPEGVQAAY